MKRRLMTYGLLLAAGCSSSSSGGSPGDDGSADSADDLSANDGSGQDVTTTPDTGGNDAPAEATNPDASDAAHADATDGGGGGDADATTSDGPTSDGSPDGTASEASTPDGSPDGSDGSADGSCPTTWFEPPTVPLSIMPDSGSGTVVLHAFGSGTQNYACIGTPIDGGADAGDAGATFTWTLVTPDAVLSDCNGATIGHHFASDAGALATAPEWLEIDNSYVIGHKLAAYTPDGGSGSIPWLLIKATGHDGSDSGVLSNVTYVQRLDADGGLAPTTGCDFGTAPDASAVNVPYTADYYFFGP